MKNTGKFREKVSPSELVIFSRQFATMMEAGIPLVTVLKALEKQTENLFLKKVINEIRIDIESGISLSESMEKHPKIFSDFFISMIKAGETAGALNKVLERMAGHLEKQSDLKRVVRGAFAYPAIVGALALLVGGFLVVVIVPVFKSVYSRLNVELPLPTLLLIGISNAVRGYWWLILILSAGAVFLFKWIGVRFAFKTYIDKFKINMPIFGKLLRKETAARFIRTLGDMMASGVPLLDSLRTADRVASNKVVSNIAQEMINNVQTGSLISDSLQNQDIFSAATAQMIASGEESGRLSFMLEKTADGLDKDVDDTVRRLVIKIEPLMTFLMALFVGFIAVAIYLPIFDVIKQMH
ncbi:MAG: type II secretion system F family protein [Candidatus Omnitrophota bacterium]